MLHIIWDFDGTLVDSGTEILETIKSAVQDAGLPLSVLTGPVKIGPPLEEMLRKALPPRIVDSGKVSEIIACFRRRYDSSDFTMTTAFPGMNGIISDSNSFTHHIVTNKPEFATRRIIEKLGWTDSIASVTTPYSFAGKRQEKTELFASVMDTYGRQEKFVGIGDMPGDGIAARNNHIMSLGVLWGTGTREELAGCCDVLFDSPGQLGEFLNHVLPLN